MKASYFLMFAFAWFITIVTVNPSCTPQERQAILSADEAACAVSQALSGKAPETVSQICKVELPVARQVVESTKNVTIPAP